MTIKYFISVIVNGKLILRIAGNGWYNSEKLYIADLYIIRIGGFNRYGWEVGLSAITEFQSVYCGLYIFVENKKEYL